MKADALVLVLCASVSANYLPARQAAPAQPPFDASSIAQVLGTALPHSLLQAAVTNPASVASMIAADFSAGRTPEWFRALPTSLQSELLRTGITLPIAAAPTRTQPPFALPPIVNTSINPSLLSSILYSRTPTGTQPSSTSTASHTMTTSSTTTSSTTSSTTTITSSQSSSETSSSSSSTSANASTSAPSSTGGAMPTAALGLGLSGLLGLAGLLAL